ncbi:globin [Corynebacterium yudongzhengii]|uniref:Globin n=1 Tax=Corynebacterium yudongzhengii TaxID=2080740 RepID=A0A2U1T8T3_9CORY|nr:globin [Corynebacterium yudongzhengii]AWB82524.1 globin [Corynebacterium yudongzhengii]PWC02420.1 globin [Corynebacterium yudongzhengii]
MFAAVGGEKTFRKIVRGFYAQVPDDDILGPMYPVEDMAGAEDRLYWFLSQYWGGPRTYQEKRGNPMLRRRHFPFAIDEVAAERWLELMARSLEQIDNETLPAPHRAAIWNHMQQVAYMMINRPG